MKLSIEMKDDHITYEYEIGSTRHHATQKISAEFYLVIADVVKHLHQLSDYEHKKHRQNIDMEISGKTWIEENKEAAAEFLKTGKR